ncbi:hypothetical protein L1987_29222 [Smallanthus sonchifolius]|uniref:Uncharacterized protein n=1 Tax=Smallanthus sonchifolius TaxID=185202 RepID=A0ACB9HZC0_9ASTR|nr:hypothetical protein L1987_29222 [Smallanthus sonchifolius]
MRLLSWPIRHHLYKYPRKVAIIQKPPESPSPQTRIHKSVSMEMETEMEMENLNIPPPRRAQSAISIEEETAPTPPRLPTQFHNYTGILYLVYAATLLYMFPSLIALVGLKFQNKANSPFETESFFVNLAVVAYIIAIPMPVALFCLKARLARESSSPFYYRILQCVFCFWSLLAPLSFVLVLFLPNRNKSVNSKNSTNEVMKRSADMTNKELLITFNDEPFNNT